ncbi:hypothetical protein D9757_010153 [Collybiopsis confluens]|uniref:Pkinase-domain-containing protein n=1 Tax=Collybiopsis confluens TaxID=2823264 RepID=A0A8H5LZ08_9AGAR|nr:hypothetical protein D9757_010153 [Collybiopsis confluens]
MSSQPEEADIEQTQQTQELSQERVAPKQYDEHLWASLLPITREIKQVDLMKPQPLYRVGRNARTNTIVFPAIKISNSHAEISWDGQESFESVITLKDLSSNGTFVNGVKVGKGNSRVLTDGVEIAFGSAQSPNGNPLEDYRFIFRHTASGRPPEDGFYGLYDTAYQLGRGSFASVIKCMERSTGLFWAAKMFNNPVSLGSTAGSQAAKMDKMVSREISILQALSHPNICYLKDIFLVAEGKLILVLELVEGGDLLEYILSRSGLGEDVAQHITYQLCLALTYVHGLGIAHRDLKPENVLLTKENPPNVKVADFGLAKATDSQTMLKTMCGTPAYLAPEVVTQTNTEGYDHLVDSWSVGVIVFSMLTNASPFLEDDNQQDLRMKIATRTIDWTVLKTRTENPMIIDFIESLLNNDPASRMTLSGALDHPWLQEYAKKAGRNTVEDRKAGKFRDGEMTPAYNGNQIKGSGVFAHGFGNLAISDSNGVAASDHAGPSTSTGGDGVASTSNVTDDHDEPMEDSTPPPPSSQTRKLQPHNSRVLRRRREFEAKNAAESSKRHGKRAHGDLSVVPEGEAVNDIGGSAVPGGDESMEGGEDDSVAQPAPSKRARQTPPPTAIAPASTRGKKAKKSEPDPTTLRRSGRNATKSNSK